ncbi:Outer membrane lipoprotein-sorting protein [Paenibacillus sp. UNCCL117]|uniref:outer membrane lipoprotein-sorting protein n=1 Tax=unclassified Paenibacillus TaxID=185978 RepID=UPI00087FD540|nr:MULTISPECIES: outer membrane lipoprotein-sorting protein [unclassified Paenibacillus]SDD91827.1 Outer membrane lipoprotein-sorting protein [Paenibacillus sp. cl123]SFW43623.1 Outer membrane lipoprotein-sorting protein [Paenibacillus sp. UNCCL117]
MRRFKWAVAVMLCLSLVLTGCGLVGKKDAGSIVKDLDGVVGKLDSYHAEGRMTLNTGTEPQEYAVEVCFMADSYYRISLTNAKKDITQIVLRNDDGVFVLTPHLNKSFRFQSDWPENQGQVYLYQSLVQSILMDNERQFTTDENSYVFDVAANYQNGSLARQKVWLDKKNYAPQHVEVADANNNVMVIVKFDKFEFGTKFEKDQFDMQRNMTGSSMKTLPTVGHDHGAADKAGAAGTGDKGTAAANGQAASKQDNASSDKAAAGSSKATSGANQGATSQATGKQDNASGDKAATETSKATTGTNQAPAGQTGTTQTGAGKSASGAGGASNQLSFGIIEPNYMPSGVKKQDMTEIKLGEDKAVMIRYAGTYNYTLIESRPKEKTVSILPGEIMDLGFTLGVVTGDAKKTLTWTYDGVEFRLSTGDLPDTEMIKVAQAVQGEMGK